nr:uncharacterized protein LOC122273271 [Parasteatoda tepidariorum]
MDPDRADQQVLLSFSQCYHALYLLQQKIKILHDQMERIKGTTQNLHSKFIFHPANHKPSMHSSFASNSFPPLCIFPPGTPESLNSPARCAFSFEPICLSEESLSNRSPSLKIEESSDGYNDQNPLFKENKMITKIILNASSENSSSEDDSAAEKLPNPFRQMFDRQVIKCFLHFCNFFITLLKSLLY